MSLAVLVVEAAIRSGSLITARMANEQGRVVLAVPGHPLDPRAEGTNGLLKQGATLITSPADLLETLAPLTASAPPEGWSDAGSTFHVAADAPEVDPPSTGDLSTPEEATSRVLASLGPAPVAIDEITRATGLPMRAVRAALLELALEGRIEQHGAQLVSLR